MEIGKVIKLQNWNFISWTRKHDMKFNSSLCSFYKIMKITRWLEYNRLIIKKKEKKIEKLKILALKHLIKSGKVKCEKTYLKNAVLGTTHGHCVKLYPTILELIISLVFLFSLCFMYFKLFFFNI